METTKICPKCGKTYRGHPAISRVDNETPISYLRGFYPLNVGIEKVDAQMLKFTN